MWRSAKIGSVVKLLILKTPLPILTKTHYTYPRSVGNMVQESTPHWVVLIQRSLPAGLQADQFCIWAYEEPSTLDILLPDIGSPCHPVPLPLYLNSQGTAPFFQSVLTLTPSNFTISYTTTGPLDHLCREKKPSLEFLGTLPTSSFLWWHHLHPRAAHEG